MSVKIKHLNLEEMAQLYDLLKPHLIHSETYQQLILDVFRRDVSKLNTVFELLTKSKADDVDGLEIIKIIPDALKENNFGKFVSLMKAGRDGSNHG